jgi:hypothetical protein
LFVNLLSSRSVLVFLLSLEFLLLSLLFRLDAILLLLDLFLFAHFFTVDLFALFSFGGHRCFVGLVRFAAGFFLFGSCFFTDFLAADGAEVAQDGFEMFRG